MNTQTLERILLGFGALVLLGFAASYFVEALHSYHNGLRIAAIAGVALYAVYSFMVQTKDQKEIYSAEKEAEKFESQARKERRRGDELQEANLTLQADLSTASKEIEALRSKVADLEAKLAEKE